MLGRLRDMTLKVAVVGASGRMGRLVVELVNRESDLDLHAALGSQDPLELIEGADVVVDFTVPGQTQRVVEAAVARSLPIVVGTSGWSADRIASVEHSLGDSPASSVLIIPNFSLGSVVASALAATAARYFDSIEIIEAHHAAKVDSPSGTAVRTAELMGRARDELGPVAAPHSDQRARGQRVASIPIHSLRMNGIVAKQDVILGGTGETVTISHLTTSNESYHSGILLAIRSAPATRGVLVGLDRLLGITKDDTSDSADDLPEAGPTSGQAATATSS